MFEILDSDDPTVSPSTFVLPDELLEFYGRCYLMLPAIVRRRLTFSRYLVHRNGGLFEKLRHHRQHRHGRSQMRAPGRGDD